MCRREKRASRTIKELYRGDTVVQIRKEQWRKQSVIVARNEKGQLLSWRKQTPDLSLERARELYSSNKTFSQSTSKVRMKNFAEFTNLVPAGYVLKTTPTTARVQLIDVKAPKRRSRAKLTQWIVKLKLRRSAGDTSEIVARSNAYDDRSKSQEERAREEAWQNVLRRLAQAAGLEYEPDEGESVFDSFVSDAKEGKVTYEPVYQRVSARSSVSS